MQLQKSLEKKLNETIKEYNLINKDEVKSTSKEIYYPHNHKKLDPSKKYPKELRIFNSDDVSVPAKIAKEYIKEFKDPDILELHQKRWDGSSRPILNYRPELKKTLFEVRHGLKDVNLILPKEKNIVEGTDTRDVAYYGWNNSHKIESDEKKSLELKNLESSYQNSIKKWKLIEKKMFDGSIRPYQPPSSISKEFNDAMRSLKKSKHDYREAIKKSVQYEFPKASDEKVAAITYSRMSPDLVKDTKILQGKNIDYYSNEHFDYGLSKLKKIENTEKLKDDNLLYGSNNGKTFKNYESKNKNIFYNDERSIIKSKEKNNLRDATSDIFKLELANSLKNKPNDIDGTRASFTQFNANKTSVNDFDRQNNLPKLSQTSQINTHNFNILNNQVKSRFNAFNNYNYKTGGSFEAATQQSPKKQNPWIKFEYSHPGKWTKLETEIDRDKTGDQRVEAWSCCISTEKNSQGCIKIAFNKKKWIYESFI